MHLYAPARMQGQSTLRRTGAALPLTAGAAPIGVLDHRIRYVVTTPSCAIGPVVGSAPAPEMVPLPGTPRPAPDPASASGRDGGAPAGQGRPE
ncbi:hypothetical protein [Streptomyces celluloflavus]|uniref:hypothetical protein n=1 Tax=Streptomyces celluloflavus TaxID=58344 RepID=UPI0036610397